VWDERYSRPGFMFGTDPAAFLVAQKKYLIRGQSALAVADGEGRNSVYLAERGLEVTAIDSSEVGLDKARGLAAARSARVDYQLADLKTFDWGTRQYDLVVAIFIQFAGPDFRAEIFAGLKAALKQGGVLLLHGYTPKQIEFGTGGPPSAANMYDETMLQTTFDDLEILDLRAYEKVIDEGPGHSGRSALIDMVARKPPGWG